MKITILISFLILTTHCYSQYFSPEELIVNATGLRFRTAPDLNAQKIANLEEGELLDLLELVDSSDPDFTYFENLSLNWLKVKRQKSGEVGYVYGQYVQPSQLAFSYGQDCNKLSLLNWYGIILENEIPILIKVKPQIVETKLNPIVIDSTESYLFIGTKKNYNIGPVNGVFFHNERLLQVAEGEEKKVKDLKGNMISFEVCHDFEVKNNEPINKVERLLIKILDADKNEILYQDLTEQYKHTGTSGFWIHFVGDINKDQLPEIFMFPLEDESVRNLWFISEAGKLELKSITYFGKHC